MTHGEPSKLDSSKGKPGKRVLVIEDDRTLSRLLVQQLDQLGHAATGVGSWREARQALNEFDPSLALLDMRLPDADGLQLLPKLTEQCPVVVLTAYGSIDQAVQAIKAGASDYLTKPVTSDQLELAVDRALETSSLRLGYEFFKGQLLRRRGGMVIGESKAFTDALSQVEMVAATDTTVLIQGETGVGKELVAKAIHQQSARAGRNFVPLDCCTLQENLFESELFGHERGAFTGADRRKQGLIEVAEGGTLFLDEIGEISAALQAKLLRVLETGKFRRLGGTKDLSSDVRFVAATNRDLRTMGEAGKFRLDLYFRLAAFVITIPALRQRPEDIAALAQHFLDARSFARHVVKRLSPAAFAALSRHDWPGNVRELKNVIERAILMSNDGPEIGPGHLGQLSKTSHAARRVELTFDDYPTLEQVKQAYVARLLREHEGHRARIAAILGVSERNLYRMIKKDGYESVETPFSRPDHTHGP